MTLLTRTGHKLAEELENVLGLIHERAVDRRAVVTDRLVELEQENQVLRDVIDKVRQA